MTKSAQSERGQVMVLIIVSLVALLGFAALAIDGGMIYSERRVAQNAADAAAYAGAASLSQEIKNYAPGELVCTDFTNETNKWSNAATKKQFADQAVDRAADNTFSIAYQPVPANVTPNDNAVWMECAKDLALKIDYIDVHVRITKQVSTSLMHLFYNGPAVNTVDSVVRVYPPAGVVIDTTILATCKNGTTAQKDGLTVGGSTSVTITKGKMVSNCKINSNGAKGKYEVPAGINYYLEEPDFKDANLVSPTTVTKADPISFPYSFGDTLKDRCAATYAGQPVLDQDLKTDIITTLNPGKYGDINLSKGSLMLNPGLYCIYGSLDIDSSKELILVGLNYYAFYAKDVTIYLASSADDVKINGGVRVHLSSPSEDCFKYGQPCNLATNGPPVKGLLIWYEPIDKTVTLNGNSTSVFEGTIAAPRSYVKLLGGTDTITNFGVQVIADDIEISGNSTINIKYEAEKLFRTDTQMGLER